jgi:2'-5' RNA ligase
MDGGMIALLPVDPQAMVIDHVKAEPADQLHVTLTFLGEDVTDWGETRKQQIIDAVTDVAAEFTGNLPARVMGHATFNPDGGPAGDRDPCAVYLVGDSPVLAPLAEAMGHACGEVLGGELPSQFTPYLPHITAAYGATAADLTYIGSVEFDRLAVAIAGDWTEIPLASANQLAARRWAREAYAHGWARSGGPMTSRVTHGCEIALELTGDHPGMAEALAATLKLGSLEGTWAKIYERRERLYEVHIAAVTAAYRVLVKGLGIDDMVRRLQRAPLGEDADDDARRRAALTATALAEATRLLHQVMADTSSPAYKATVTALADALADAQAEGVAGGIALVAAEVGTSAAVDFGLAFADAHAELANLGTYWQDAQGWLGQVVNGNAADLGQSLARVAVAGGDYSELRAAAADALGGDDIRAVDTLVDLAMGQSFSRGALTLYGREGVTTVDFVTAGGTRVCPICMNAESGNVWSLGEAPHPALHPYCRCALMPSVDSINTLSASLSRYLTVSSA